jgi:uncharacterized protein (DUF1684 family)
VLLLLIAVVAAPAGAAAAAAAAPPAAADYAAEVEAWRREREARLRAPDGWLSLVGLTWLGKGASRFGSAPDDDVPLPAPAPPHAGTLLVDGTSVRIRFAPGVKATLNGKPWVLPSGGAPLRTDAGDAEPDVIGFGGVTLQVIDRDGRLGARVKDPESPARKHFAGLAWFPIDRAYQAIARLEAHAAPTEIVVPDASGGKQRLQSPGTLAFTMLGRPFRLDPVRDGPDDGDLLVIFRDLTAGHETYGGGRFLRARRRPDGAFVVDFNRAYSPPCAFTPHATCPLPPPQNRLPLRVPAGEKLPPGHQ